MKLWTTDKAIAEAYCLMGRKVARGKWQLWALDEADLTGEALKGCNLDFVCWFKEPTDNMIAAMLPCLGGRLINPDRPSEQIEYVLTAQDENVTTIESFVHDQGGGWTWCKSCTTDIDLNNLPKSCPSCKKTFNFSQSTVSYA